LPASQKVEYEGFEISARPAWWLRRWIRFPLFFQATHPSFEIIIKKVSESQLNNLNFYVEFPDKATVPYPADVSLMKLGDTIKLTTKRILLAPTGDTRICLDMGQHIMIKGRQFHTLYAFVVSAEATLVFLLLNVILGAIIAILLKS